jgi:hypothetical protein
MIQRKQTLFLLFSIIILVGYLFSPVIRVEDAGVVTNIFGYDLKKNIPFPIIGRYFVYITLDAAITAIVLNLITIFLYKKRKWQMAFCWLSSIPVVFAFCFTYYHWATTDSTSDTVFYYGNISLGVSVVFILLAWFFIKKDEELVKSLDRLR